MTDTDQKAVLHRYLRSARAAVLWKLDGLSEYDARRPMTPTGTNLLGLVKHLGCVEYGYFGQTFGRPPAEPLPWGDDDGDPNGDLYATAAESRRWVLDFHARAVAHADATIEALPLDTAGRVPWWPADRNEMTLQHALVHVLAETNRHAGHADIMRERIDGAAGLRAEHSNLPDTVEGGWAGHVERLERIAREA